MKQIILFLLIPIFLFGENIDINATQKASVDSNQSTKVENAIEIIKAKDNNNSEDDLPSDEPIIVDDTSGLSDSQIREKAKKDDDKKKKKISVDEVINAIDNTGHIDVSEIQSSWEDMSPSPKKYDWIQSKSGEWFKGEIKALYDDKLEFDSDEIGDYTFTFKDIKQIKSFNMISVNIEDVAEFTGIIRFKNDEITIIQGDKQFVFPSSQIVSLAPDGELEIRNWSGKTSLSFDKRIGNKNQFDFIAKVNIKRRTGKTRLVINYLGRISERNDVETANDHRLEQSLDIYLTRSFFWTPLFAEYYSDEYQNIEHQYTAGIGIGYTPIDRDWIEWDLSCGPALLHTQFIDTTNKEEKYPLSAAFEISTNLDIELSKKIDLIYSYKFLYTDDKSGRYKHHMVLTFENELTSWLDLDVSGIWDYIARPEETSSGYIPEKSDFQLLVGLGIEF